MARLFLVLVAAAAALAAVFAMMTLLSAARPSADRAATEEDWMPDTIRNVAYALLLVLMAGVATGWLGAAG